jgi:hypothetical protein
MSPLIPHSIALLAGKKKASTGTGPAYLRHASGEICDFLSRIYEKRRKEPDEAVIGSSTLLMLDKLKRGPSPNTTCCSSSL